MKLRLIKKWREFHKFASVQWSFLGFLMMTVAEVGGQFLYLVPPELKERLPSTTTIALILFGLAIIGRILTLENEDGGTQ